MGRTDVKDRWTISVDCRGVDEDLTCGLPPGTVTYPVLPVATGEVPVGEIRAILGGTEVRIVAEETGRAGVVEVTLDMLSAVNRNEDYRRNLAYWLKEGSC